MSSPIPPPDARPRTRRPAPCGRTAVREVTCRTILSPSRIPGFDYSINPYIGCTHACAYCYASYMQRYSGHGEPWGSFVDAKVNAPRVLIRRLRRTPRSSIFISSVTDPYQPAEERYRITRRILHSLLPLPHDLLIHTKSCLVERDIDILERFRSVSVSFSIVTGDRRAAAYIEPGASPVSARIRTLERLSRRGIRTGVFIAPVIPGLTEKGAERLIRRLAAAGVKRVMLDDLHHLPRIGRRLIGAVRRCDPRAAKMLEHIPPNYYNRIGRFIMDCCRYYGIHGSCCF